MTKVTEDMIDAYITGTIHMIAGQGCCYRDIVKTGIESAMTAAQDTVPVDRELVELETENACYDWMNENLQEPLESADEYAMRAWKAAILSTGGEDKHSCPVCGSPTNEQGGGFCSACNWT